jgi:hypothetical protein
MMSPAVIGRYWNGSGANGAHHVQYQRPVGSAAHPTSRAIRFISLLVS